MFRSDSYVFVEGEGTNTTKQYNHQLVGIEYTPEGVIAHFNDGTQEAGSIIVGADGGQSFVRRLLLKDMAEPESYPEYGMANLSVKYTHEQGKYIAETMAPHVDYGVHPKGIFFIMLCKLKPSAIAARKRPFTF